MSDVRLERDGDGRCMLFVGRLLVFTDLTEAQAADLIVALGLSASDAAAPSRPVAAWNEVSIGLPPFSRPRSVMAELTVPFSPAGLR